MALDAMGLCCDDVYLPVNMTVRSSRATQTLPVAQWQWQWQWYWQC